MSVVIKFSPNEIVAWDWGVFEIWIYVLAKGRDWSQTLKSRLLKDEEYKKPRQEKVSDISVSEAHILIIS